MFNLKPTVSIYLSIYLSVCLSVHRPSIHPSIIYVAFKESLRDSGEEQSLVGLHQSIPRGAAGMVYSSGGNSSNDH